MGRTRSPLNWNSIKSTVQWCESTAIHCAETAWPRTSGLSIIQVRQLYILRKSEPLWLDYIYRVIGIILSMCLTVALHIPFTPSVSVRASAVAGMPSAVELFNVYGPMRMVLHININFSPELDPIFDIFSYSAR